MKWLNRAMYVSETWWFIWLSLIGGINVFKDFRQTDCGGWDYRTAGCSCETACMTMAIPVKHVVGSRPRRTRPRRDPKALERRRMQAADLFRRGVSPAEIARRLGRVAPNRVRVAQGVAAGWPSCLALGWTCGTTSKTDTGATRQGGTGAGPRGRGQWLRHRRVDVGTRGRSDPAPDWHQLPPRTCVVSVAQPVGLDLAAPSPTCGRARRGSHRAVGREALAAVEKRARRRHALIVFEDESGVSLLPSVRATWAPSGPTPVVAPSLRLEAAVDRCGAGVRTRWQ